MFMKVTLTNYESNIVLKYMYNCSFFCRWHIVSFHIVDCIDKFPVSCISVDWDCFLTCTCEVDCCASGLFLINIVISTAVTVYIVVYPAEWIIDWMEVWHFPQIYILFLIPTVANYTVSQKKLWSRTLAITLSNFNRFQKFLHCCKEKEIYNKPCVTIPTTP